MLKLFRFFRKLKGWFFVCRLHVLFSPLVRALAFLSYISKLSAWIAKHNHTLQLTDFYSYKFDYNRRLKLYGFVQEYVKDQAFDYLEFGVSKGHSMRWWSEQVTNPEVRFYGFDTFTGLPEDWGPFKKGDMASGEDMPSFADTRVTLYKGLFQQTLPGFLKNTPMNRRKVILMDADIYSATLYVLTSVAPYLQKGDIILFDEFNVPLHEFKAFDDFVQAYYLKYKVLGSVNNFYQVAIEVL